MNFLRRLFGKKKGISTTVKKPTITTNDSKPHATVATKKTPTPRREPRKAIPKQYSCAICGGVLAGEDLVYAKKYEEDARVFYKEKHASSVPPVMIKVSNSIDNLFYCKECLSNVANWNQEKKPCLSCKSLLLNFVRLPGIPDFYCQVHGNRAVNNPRIDSCPEWQLRGVFKR
jgi:hypothetical protein